MGAYVCVSSSWQDAFWRRKQLGMQPALSKAARFSTRAGYCKIGRAEVHLQGTDEHFQ